MGIQIELWERSQIMDKLLGLCYIFYDDKENENKFHERRIILDSELVLNKQGKICRTCKPTEHSLLICTYIQLPSNLPEEESKELTKKFEILHEILDKKVNIKEKISILSFFLSCSLESFYRSHFFHDIFNDLHVLMIYYKKNVKNH